MTIAISVIIPFYNVEKYLERCLSSVRNQLFTDIEIICVNDGSSDNSHQIVSQHALQDPRIIVLNHNNNRGVGAARNTGIKAAKANYIAFVDGDDFIKEDMLDKLWTATDNSKFDVVCCGFSGIDAHGKTLAEINYGRRQIENIDHSLEVFSIFNPALWNKLWRKALFTNNNIYFPSKTYFEDMATQPCLLIKAKQLNVIDDCLYFYNSRRSDSITNTFSRKHQEDLFKGFETVLDFLEEHKLEHRYADSFNHYMHAGVLSHAKKVEQSKVSSQARLEYLQRLQQLKNSFIKTRELLQKEHLDQLQILIENNQKGSQ